MKTILLIIAVAMLGMYGYKQFQGKKEVVFVPGQVSTDMANPVYADIRVKVAAGGREIEAALFSKMADEADCQSRAQKLRDDLTQNCKNCVSQSVQCKADLAPRYVKYFADEPGNITYLSINRGSTDQREARLIFWGLTLQEGDLMCDQMKKVFSKMKTGALSCIRPVAS